MKTSLLALASVGSLLGLAGAVGAESAPKVQVDVVYVAPEDFTDFKDSYLSTEKGREWLEAELTAHLRREAQQYLAAGTRLEVKFLDINLAGDFEPQRGPQFDHIRVIREVYPPSAKLQFRVVDASGKELAKGERSLRNLMFQVDMPMWNNDPLKYDKALLTDWLRSEFGRKS